MLAVSEQSSNQPTVDADLPLMMLEPVHLQQQVEALVLRPGHHSLGSAASCSFRLMVPGVEARHCLIVVGPQRIIVKAWDKRTWINGKPVSDSLLHRDDRLVIGPVEFRVRECDNQNVRPQTAERSRRRKNGAQQRTALVGSRAGPTATATRREPRQPAKRFHRANNGG